MANDVMRLGLVLSATDKMSRVLDGVNSKFSKLDKIGKGFQKYGAIMFGAGVAVVGALAADFISVADKAKELRLETQKIGMGMEAFEKFSGYAKKTGVATDAFAASVAKMEKAMFAAAHGQKAQGAAFKMAGIEIFNSNRQAKKSEEIISELADKFSKSPDGIRKTALAMALFGKTGKDMIPMLNKGSGVLNAFGDELERTGDFLTKEESEGFKHYTEQVEHTKTAIDGLKTRIAVALLPTAIKLADKINRIAARLSNWINRNRELFNTIVKVVAIVGGVLVVLGSLAIVIGTVMWAWSMLNLAFVASPIGWIVLAVGALIAALAYCWIKFAAFRAIIKTTWETIKEFGSILKDYVMDRIKGIIEGLGSMGKAIGLLFHGRFSDAYDEAKRGVRALSGYDAKLKAVTRTKNLITGITSRYAVALSNENSAERTSKSGEATNYVMANRSNSNHSTVHYSPTIHIHGGGVTHAGIASVLKDDKKSFGQMMKEHNDSNSRLNFAH